MLIWLELRLCLIFAESVGAGGFSPVFFILFPCDFLTYSVFHFAQLLPTITIL